MAVVDDDYDDASEISSDQKNQTVFYNISKIGLTTF